MANMHQQSIKSVDTRIALSRAKQVDPELSTAEHRAWRSEVKRRAGYRCEWIGDGRRCTKSSANGDRMIADHIIERKDGGALLDPANGQCLCVSHNTKKGVLARTARMKGTSR